MIPLHNYRKDGTGDGNVSASAPTSAHELHHPPGHRGHGHGKFDFDISDLTIEIPGSQRRLTDEPPPPRWRTPEFMVYYAVFIVVVPMIVWLPMRVSLGECVRLGRRSLVVVECGGVPVMCNGGESVEKHAPRERSSPRSKSRPATCPAPDGGHPRRRCTVHLWSVPWQQAVFPATIPNAPYPRSLADPMQPPIQTTTCTRTACQRAGSTAGK
jgi:hypothetical protein